uniref:IQ motif containing F1 n=1 Tax=Mus musculus TaxID=10090 RepID=A0A1L1SS97_MOUSE
MGEEQQKPEELNAPTDDAPQEKQQPADLSSETEKAKAHRFC